LTSDGSAGEVLRLHSESSFVPMMPADPVCNCHMTTTKIEGHVVYNAGCHVHGIMTNYTRRARNMMAGV
jgi:hypothetical protein